MIKDEIAVKALERPQLAKVAQGSTADDPIFAPAKDRIAMFPRDFGL
jgi:hypothetical protein